MGNRLSQLGQPTQTFYTGRTRRTGCLTAFGALMAIGTVKFVVSAIRVLTGMQDSDMSVGTAAAVAGVVLALHVGGIILAVTHMAGYSRSMLALYAHGLGFRDWRGRERFIRWDEVTEVSVKHWAEPRRPEVLSQSASTLHVTYRGGPGDPQRLKIMTSEQRRATDTAWALARQGGLVHRGRIRPETEIWDREGQSSQRE